MTDKFSLEKLLMMLATLAMLPLMAEETVLQHTIRKDFDSKTGAWKEYDSGSYSYPSKWEQYFGNGYWSPIDTADAEVDYVVPNKITFRSPSSSTQALGKFPGKSLTIQSGGTFIAYSIGPAELDFGDGLIFEGKATVNNYSGTHDVTLRHVEASHNTVFLSPVSFSDDTSFSPADNYPRGFSFAGKLTLPSGKTLTCAQGTKSADYTSRNPCPWYVFRGDNVDFRGRLSLASRTVTFFGTDMTAASEISVAGDSGNPELGGAVSAYSATSDVSLSTLNLAADTVIEVPIGLTAGQCGRLRVVNSFTQGGKVRIRAIFSGEFAKQSFPGGKFPVLTLKKGATGSLVEDDFELTGLIDSKDTANLPLFREAKISVEPDGEDTTLYVELPMNVVLLDNSVGGNTGGVEYYCQVTNGAAWSDGQTPHAGAMYYAAQNYLRFPATWGKLPHVFGLDEQGGDSLVMAKGMLVTFGKPLSFNLLEMMSGTEFFAYGSSGSIEGRIVLNEDDPSGVVKQSILHKVTETYLADISGQGLFHLAGWIGSSSPYGTIVLAGDNSGFKGRIKVSIADAPTSSGSAGKVPTLEMSDTLCVSEAKNLGGTLDVFTFNALELGGMSRLQTQASFALPRESNRGLYVNWVGRIYTDAPQAGAHTLTLGTDVTYHGLLRKEGLGTLVLGGAARFGSDGDPAVLPEANSNLLEVVEGTLQPAHASCLDGVAVTVCPGASLAYDLVPSDDDFKSFGFKSLKEGSSVAFADADAKVAVTLKVPPSMTETEYETALATFATEELAQAFTDRLELTKPARGYAGQIAVKPNGGHYTVVAQTSHVGMILLLK